MLNYINKHCPLLSKKFQLPAKLDKECIKKHRHLLKKSLNELADEEKRIVDFAVSRLSVKYPLGYDSIKSKYPNLSYSELLLLENDIADEDGRVREQKRKAEIEREEKHVNSVIDTLAEAAAVADVEKAELSINKINGTIKRIRDKRLTRKIKNAIDDFNKKYGEGLSDPFEISSVNYLMPTGFVQGDDWKYPVSKFPQNGVVVFPFRRNKIERRGFMEARFQSELSKVLSNCKLQIIGDCGILPKDGCRPFEPDIAVIDLENTSIRIDIEIDEPYAAITNLPIHFVGCGDDNRDMRLTNLGWIVVRFAEYQVLSEMNACIAYIAQLIHKLNPTKLLPDVLLHSTLPPKQKRWTEIEAKLMAVDNYRQRYLHYEFGISDIVPLEKKDIIQTEKERECAKFVKPLIIPTENNGIIGRKGDGFAERDGKIQFYPKEHVYIYNGNEELTPVSNIVSSLFCPFDSDYWSKKKANERCVPQGQILEEWCVDSLCAREVGTFLHLQIQNYYEEGKDFQLSYHFKYDGKYVKEDKVVSLNKEYSQFKSFIKEHAIKPFRTEWPIYDEDIKIAGTIDMLHCRDGLFDIYDWKRTGKVLDSFGNPIVENYVRRKGNGVCCNIDDTPYWHYCLQQNMYRYILQTKYNIWVGKMYLVVFSDIQNDYKKLEVPNMDEVITSIIKDFRNK
ncbi:MAG: hypothetical protein ACI358_06110 [Candidatus Limimorpha sp.]